MLPLIFLSTDLDTNVIIGQLHMLIRDMKFTIVQVQVQLCKVPCRESADAWESASEIQYIKENMHDAAQAICVGVNIMTCKVLQTIDCGFQCCITVFVIHVAWCPLFGSVMLLRLADDKSRLYVLQHEL